MATEKPEAYRYIVTIRIEAEGGGAIEAELEDCEREALLAMAPVASVVRILEQTLSDGAGQNGDR